MQLTAHQSDELLRALLERVARRDANALKSLYDATSGKLFGLAMRVLKNTEHAEDVLQEAFINIWNIAPDYRQALSPPMAWMGLIVRSRALDYLRRRSVEKHLGGQSPDDSDDDSIDVDAVNPMEASMASEQAWALQQCLQRIDPKPREVLVMAYYRDLSHRELAQQLMLPIGTVKTWIRRSLDQLRVCLARFV
jgi:RNA polymerase sigma factor (sigma-70 family)